MAIAVFGSINLDLVARTPRLPAPGETLIGHSFATYPGGKGANQAVACARLGGPTWMVGRVGGDNFGERLVSGLQAEGVYTDAVRVDRDSASGVAIITVDDEAENSIIVVSGANARVDERDLEQLAGVLPQVQVLLLQLEVPVEMSMQAAALAREKGVTVILDPAPAQPLPEDFYGLIDLLTPNETEAAALTGLPIAGAADAATAAEHLLAKGAGHIIIKMGARGAYSADPEGGTMYPAFEVIAVDTVAAGDAFNGGLAVALSLGMAVEQALTWALAAGGLAVTKAGAQSAMPDRAALLSFLDAESN